MQVWLNGEWLGEHVGGYTPFFLDASGVLRPDAENLLHLHQRLKTFPPEIGRLMGMQLGTYHSAIGQKIGAQPDHDFFPRRPPWILSLHQQDEKIIIPTMIGPKTRNKSSNAQE